jgi:hypothetical protein
MFFCESFIFGSQDLIGCGKEKLQLKKIRAGNETPGRISEKSGRANSPVIFGAADADN